MPPNGRKIYPKVRAPLEFVCRLGAAVAEAEEKEKMA